MIAVFALAGLGQIAFEIGAGEIIEQLFEVGLEHVLPALATDRDVREARSRPNRDARLHNRE